MKRILKYESETIFLDELEMIFAENKPWIIKDRHEPDKLFIHLESMKRAMISYFAQFSKGDDE
jgi:hypothetical protein